MVNNNSEDRQSVNDRQIGEDDQNSRSNSSSVTRRLAEILMEQGDGDLLLQMSDREEGFLQWIRALDMQVMGACRADERLKPLLKMNGSSGVAEDSLLSNLSQHFEPSEVGVLARCLCVPLVSIRVGKVSKQGTLLNPTSIRGNLCLTLLPTSDLRILFNGDDGSRERLATIITKAPAAAVAIEEICADKSGRSFLMKASDDVVYYFWCCEKSKLLGDELLRKMKDLLVRKPSLAELTGISESRLNCFAAQLRAHLTGPVLTSAQASGLLEATLSSADSVDSPEIRVPQSSFNGPKGSRSLQNGSQGSKTIPIYQGSLGPRLSSFKEPSPRTISSIKTAAREILRRQGENYVPLTDGLIFASSTGLDLSCSSSLEKDKLPEANEVQPFTAFNFFDIGEKSANHILSSPKTHNASSSSSQFSPHYCWCPPVASALQFTLGNSKLSVASSESLSLSLPPLSSLLSASRSSNLLTPMPSLNLADIPPLNFPGLLSEPLVMLPTSQQIPTFTPLMCDPIVHIPVIDVCSSGQGYLVSTGPGVSATIPPLNQNFVDSLLPNVESMAEKNARETLRVLISNSNQPNSNLLEVLPSVFSSNSTQQDLFLAGSRGFYGGMRDVDAIANSRSILLPDIKSIGDGIGKSCVNRDDPSDPTENPPSSGPNRFDAWKD